MHDGTATDEGLPVTVEDERTMSDAALPDESSPPPAPGPTPAVPNIPPRPLDWPPGEGNDVPPIPKGPPTPLDLPDEDGLDLPRTG
jgi:hypothetical protein